MNSHSRGSAVRALSEVIRVFVLCSLMTFAASTVAAEDRADDVLARKLAEFPGAGRGKVIAVAEPSITSVFPNHHFYVLRFRQYPVAVAPPEPLQSNNLFVVKPDASVEHLRDTNGLESFVRAALPSVTTADQAKGVAKAWLHLVEEFRQDGFFQFSIRDDSLHTVSEPDGGLTVTGTAIVSPRGGNAGEIVASLTFDKAGRLVKASETASVKRGIRPRCQATRLLDPDPIVRGMAEEAILVMGKDAKEYLDEVRRTASAQLRQAIDFLWERIRAEDR